MRVLLDTHVFLWSQTRPERLGAHRELVEDEGNDLLVSAVVAWEIAIKYALGRLPLPEPPARWMPARMAALVGRPVPVEQEHALAVAALPPVHKDPFDRLLVAQARILRVPLLTADPVLATYEVETLMVEA